MKTSLLLVAYVSTVAGANWLIETFGVVPIGLGLMAPAGVFAAGLAFSLRDLLQDQVGKPVMLGAIGAGALLSLIVSSPFIAGASALAFLVSELADFAVYTPLRERGWLRAVALSNVVGIVVDSCLFLALAFGSLEFLPGLLLAKLYTIPPAVVALWVWRRRCSTYRPSLVS